MKKECENCGNFTQFYSKIDGQYLQTSCGQCWANKDITGCKETCENWEVNFVNNNRTQDELIKAFDAMIASIGVIKDKLTEK